ncbi:MAG: hypothetical protein IKJ55_07175 [Clostridia bacterium]|nr:hypothetical protein [Clostridia bacterium]
MDAPVYSIAGEISFEGTRSQGIVTLYDAQGTLLAEMQKPAGTYAFSMLEPGVYTVKFEKQSHLPEVREAEITNAHITGVNASLKAGDVTGDKIINLSDFGVVTSMFGQEAGSAEQKKADFMEDGTVNIHELTKMIENYGEDRRSE